MFVDDKNELFELTPVLVRDLHDKINLWNTGMEKLYGFTKKEACGKISHELFHTQFPIPLEKIREHVFNNGQWEGELRQTKKDGSVIIVHTLWILHRNSEGSPSFIVEVNADITGHKRMESALRESEERLVIAKRAAGLGIFDHDLSTPVINCDEKVKELWNVPFDKPFTFDDFFRKMHPDDRQKTQAAIDKAYNPDGDGSYRTEYRVLSENNQKNVRWISVTGKVFFINRKPSRIIGTMQEITEQKDAQLELQKISRQHQLALDSASMGWWHLDPSTSIVNVDSRFKELFGLTKDEFHLDEFRYKILNQEYLPDVNARIEAALNPSDPKPYAADYRIILPDGAERWIEAHGIASFEGEGDLKRAVSFVGTVRDITERKQAEKLLEESAQQFRTMANAIPNLAWIAHADGYIYWYNQRWYEYTGTTPEQMEGWGWQSVHNPETLPKVLVEWKKSITTGKPFDMEFPLRGADGQYHTFLTRVMPFKNSEGEVVQWFGTNTDVDELKRVEEALRASRDRFAILARISGELLQTSEPQKQVESLCKSVMEYLDCQTFFNFLVDKTKGRLHLNAYSGIPQEEAQKIEWLDFGVAVCGCAAAQGCRIVAEHIPSVDDPRTTLVKSFGIKAYACHPLFVEGGRVIGTLSFGSKTRDVFSNDDLSLMKAVADQVAIAMSRVEHENGLQRRTEELADANRELEAFSYSVSHDLRAPLRAMRGFSEFLIEDYGKTLDETGRDYLNRIMNGAKKMNTIIDDMLVLSKISRQQISITGIDLSAMAEAKIKDLKELQPDRTVEVLIKDGVRAEGDSHLINLALGNLLNNAWKYTGKKDNPRIEFGDFEKDGQTIYYVKDNGAGFDPKQADKLFAPFQRLHSETEFTGTGVGLAIVERAIRRNGGKVWAEGETGKGAVFYFTLNPAVG